MGATHGLAALPARRATRVIQLLLLIVATAAAYYARTTLGPLQETMRIALSFSDNQMAVLQGPPLALGMVGTVPLGLLIDRYSRVRLVFILSVLTFLSSLLVAWASTFALLFAARCLTGLTVSAIWIAVLSLLADFYSPARRGRATMAVALGATAGISGAFALGGVLLAMFGPGPDSWRWAMVSLSAPLLVATLLTLAMQEPARTGLAVETSPAREVYAELWRYRTVLVPLMASFALVGGIADGAAVIWAAPTLSRSFGLPPERVGAIMGVIILICGLLGPILGGSLVDLSQRTGGPHRAVNALTGLLFLSIPAGLFPIAPAFPSASALLVMFLTLGAAFSVAVQALTTIIIPNELRGSCLALMLALVIFFAFGAAPLLVSQLSETIGGLAMIGKALASVCMTSSILGAATFLFARRHLRAAALR